MDVLKNWWSSSSKQEKTVQLIVALMIFTFSANVSNAAISIAWGLAVAYILYDCYQKKSFSGFRMSRENWIGIAIFLGSVLLASLLLGEKGSIHMAFRYVYWALPFLLAAYLGKLADIRYAAASGALLSVAVSSINVAYLHYLFLQGHKLVGPGGPVIGGRLGAFLSYPTHHAQLLACMFPLLLCFYADKKLRRNPVVAAISMAVTVLGLWSLWKTGSRGGMISLFAGGLSVFALFCFFHKQGKLFRNGLTVGVAAVAVVLLVGIQDGNRAYGDSARVRMWQASYAMWKDHKLLGVGLENWQKEYAGEYILKDEIRQVVLQRYQDGKKAAEQRATVTERADAKREGDHIAAWQNEAIKQESAFDMPHNIVAWFFSTTGVIGGVGYLLFVAYYSRLFCSKVKEHSDEWILYVGLWSFLAISIHGFVDAGITNKEAARLLFLILGISLNLRYYKAGLFC
jgi:O-antigen ligase